MATVQRSTTAPPTMPSLLSMVPKPVIAHCPRPACRFAASALTEGRAIRSLAAHIVKTHLEVNRGN